MERHTTDLDTDSEGAVSFSHWHAWCFLVRCILIYCLAFLGSTTVRIPDGAYKLGPDEWWSQVWGSRYVCFVLSKHRAIFVWPWNENAQIKQKQQTNGKRAIWLVNRTDTNRGGFWLVKRTLGWKNLMPENFLEFNRYLALTSYYNTIGQSNNAFSILVYFWRENEESTLWSFHPLADKTNNEHLPKPFFKIIRKSLLFLNHFTTRTWYR